MKQPDINYWIGTMLDSYDHVSDLNITAGKTLQVESSGVLQPVTVRPEVDQLTPFSVRGLCLEPHQWR